MTRSNGPTSPHGGWPHHAHPGDADPQTAAQHQNRRPQQPAYPPEPQFAPPQYPYAQDPGAPSYAPQFDSYQPHQPAHQPGFGDLAPPPMPSYDSGVYDHRPAASPPQGFGAQPPGTQAAAPHAPEFAQYGHGYEARGDQRAPAYEQWPAPAPQLERGFEQPAPAHDPYAANQYADPYAPQPGLDLNNYALPPHSAGELDHAHQGTALEAPLDDDELDYEDYEEEPPRRGRMMLIAGALVGAIAVGSGLAYGYKTLFPADAQVATPVIKSDGQPARSRPSDPGGKQFSHADSKIMGKLGDNGAAPAAGTAAASTASAASAGETDANGTRKVQTLVVRPDGTFASPPTPVEPPATPPAASPPTAQAVAVPGMTIVDGLGGSRQPPPVVAPVTPPARTVAVAPPPQPAPVVTAPAPAPAPQVTAAPPPVKKIAAAPPVETAAVPPEPKKPAPKKEAAPRPTGAGYMAVLASVPASQKSRMDALKQFADMQQKYGSVLANKTPDVQEADLGDKGTYHRLLVGPPGSREQANAVCADLKAAGYNGCWVMAY